MRKFYDSPSPPPPTSRFIVEVPSNLAELFKSLCEAWHFEVRETATDGGLRLYFFVNSPPPHQSTLAFPPKPKKLQEHELELAPIDDLLMEEVE